MRKEFLRSVHVSLRLLCFRPSDSFQFTIRLGKNSTVKKSDLIDILQEILSDSLFFSQMLENTKRPRPKGRNLSETSQAGVCHM